MRRRPIMKFWLSANQVALACRLVSTRYRKLMCQATTPGTVEDKRGSSTLARARLPVIGGRAVMPRRGSELLTRLLFLPQAALARLLPADCGIKHCPSRQVTYQLQSVILVVQDPQGGTPMSAGGSGEWPSGPVAPLADDLRTELAGRGYAPRSIDDQLQLPGGRGAEPLAAGPGPGDRWRDRLGGGGVLQLRRAGPAPVADLPVGVRAAVLPADLPAGLPTAPALQDRAARPAMSPGTRYPLAENFEIMVRRRSIPAFWRALSCSCVPG